MTTPAGWYPDSSGQQRYWDGNAWTEHVQPAAGDAGAPQPPAGAPQAAQQGYGQSAPAAPGGYGGSSQRWAPTAYLEGAGSDFGGAISNAFANMTTWEGRASRSSFWWFALGMWIVSLIVYMLLLAVRIPAAIFVLDILVFLAGLAVSIRRLHDTDRSGWWYLIGLVPCVGWIILIIFYVMESTPGPNQYNIDPTGGPQAH